nr:unnamed protein product [Digitaria exilis]
MTNGEAEATAPGLGRGSSGGGETAARRGGGATGRSWTWATGMPPQRGYSSDGRRGGRIRRAEAEDAVAPRAMGVLGGSSDRDSGGGISSSEDDWTRRRKEAS